MLGSIHEGNLRCFINSNCHISNSILKSVISLIKRWIDGEHFHLLIEKEMYFYIFIHLYRIMYRIIVTHSS